MRLRLLAALGVSLWLVGCGTAPRTGAPAPVVGGEPAVEPPPGTEVRPYVPPSLPPVQRPDARSEAPRPMPNRAVQVLLRRSQDQLRDGDLNAAAASLERAIRISPRAPELWYRLAEIRERQGQFGQAADLAAKSNALAGDSDPALSRDNWWLIARARRAVGDLAGARAAERHAVAQQLKLR
jgi:hypothetical protein